MVGATLTQDGDSSVKVSVMWLIFTYLFLVFGELCLSPIGLSLVSKLAPAKFLSLLMGAWFLCTAAANKIAGIIGGFIGEGEAQINNSLAIFSGLAISGFVAGIVVYLFADKLVDWMHGAEGQQHVEHDAMDHDLT